MLRARVDEVRAGKLAYSPEALKSRAVNDVFFRLRKPDIAVYRVRYFACKIQGLRDAEAWGAT
jgi:hypothetical protein